MKIAVATSDDGKVTEHFGKAQNFLIYGFDGDELAFLEARKSTKDPEEKHQWGKSLKVTGDCDVIISSQMGMRAKAGLKGQKVKIVEDQGAVEEVLQRYVAHYKFMNEPL